MTFDVHALLTQGVPEINRKDKDCMDAYVKVLRELNTPERIEGVCIHEAGHFIYAERLGIKIGFGPNDIIMHGPRIIHTPNPDAFHFEFEPSPGMVETPLQKMGVPLTIGIMEMLADISVAGSVFAGRFFRQSKRGIAGDSRTFEAYYRIALNGSIPDIKNHLECSGFLRRARMKVTRELRTDAEMQSLAKKIAQDYKSREFEPYLEFCRLVNDFDQANPETREV
jgi:hypothetical protein